MSAFQNCYIKGLYCHLLIYSIPLSFLQFDIGRCKEADCCIIDTNISRKHAKLKFDHGTKKWTIIDNKVRIIKTLFAI